MFNAPVPEYPTVRFLELLQVPLPEIVAVPYEPVPLPMMPLPLVTVSKDNEAKIKTEMAKLGLLG